MAWNYPTTNDEVIDSRDVISRIEDLESERKDLVQAVADACAICIDSVKNNPEKYKEAQESYREANNALIDWDHDNADELKSLQDLASEGEDATSEWRHGETLIREDYWVEYVQDLCKDIGDLPQDIPHYIVIDWDETARNIAMDYSTISFDGVDYYIRNC